MTFTIHHILPAVSFILSLFCGLFVLLKSPKKFINQIFFLLCITFMGWMSFYFFNFFPLTDDGLITWYKISFCFISFIPIASYTFTSAFLNLERHKLWFKINCCIGLSLSILSIATDTVVSGINYLPWFPYAKAGPGLLLLVIHSVTLVGSTFILLIKAKPTNKNQFKYASIATTILSLSPFDFLPCYNIKLYPIGEFTCCIYLTIISFAIIKHHLLDINILIKKGLVYSLLISFMTLSYLIVVLITEKLFNNYFGYKDFASSLISAIIIAVCFIPLRNKFQKIIDRIFFKGTNEEIALQNERLKQEITQTERLKSVATLASGIAHEIRNPLTVIQAFTEHLPNKMNDKEFLIKFTPLLKNEVTRMNCLLQELLTFSKPTPVQLKPILINPIIDSTLELASNTLNKHKITLIRDYKNTTVILNLDANQIKQAILNITLNAVDAMSDGGTLTISTHLINNDQTFQLMIIDTGCGIDPKDIPHIFDPFFTKKDHGTGLGLSVTYEIIKNHNGKIFVESKKDVGTTFIIELPTCN